MKTLLSAVIGAVLALCAIEAEAQAVVGERSVTFVIESKTLAEALDKWAQQTGFQLFSPDWDIAENLEARRLDGTFTPQAALEALLRGTPLTYSWIDNRTVAIRRTRLPTSSTASGHGGTADAKRLPLEAAGLMEFTEIPPSPQRLQSNEGSGDVPKVDDLEEIFVTGTHIHGVENNTVPVIVLDRDHIESTGLSTSAALLESLPQNFALANPAGVLVPGVSNPEVQGSSVNLRGIGEGTTLTLINGRRMASGFFGRAADISALPLSAIERVEVLTDGASAIYGSDAVGGVVNFILRRNFEGAETHLRSGWADGVNEYQLSQALGTVWSSGSALLSVDYYKRDLLKASERDFVPSDAIIGSLYPRDRNLSALFTAEQGVGDKVRLFTDVLYMNRDTYNEGGRIIFDMNRTSENPQIAATAGLRVNAGNWEIEGSGTYARNKVDSLGHSTEPEVPSPLIVGSRFTTEAAELRASGPLFHIPGGAVRAAAGTSWRSESFGFQNPTFGLAQDAEQRIRSAFAETYIPLVGRDNSMAGVRRFELSVAGRLDDYSSFGSSFDPRFGLMWEPLSGLRLRASYGTSYVAPSLADYDVSLNSASSFLIEDPGSPTGLSRLLTADGSNPEALGPQESRSSSFGVEFAPGSVPGLQLAANYYRIDYSDRIATPPAFTIMLVNPDSFAGLLVRNPTTDQINEAIASGLRGFGFFAFDENFNPDPNFDPSTVNVLADTRRRNLSRTKTSGIDMVAEYTFGFGDSAIQLGVTGTYILELTQRATDQSAPLDTVGTIYNPPDWRLRASFGWKRGGWSANLFLNHSDSYVDSRTPVPGPVASYTTMDARLAYELGGDSVLLSNLVIAASVQNATDRDPPHVAVLLDYSDMGFDPTNASPMGRLISIELAKKW